MPLGAPPHLKLLLILVTAVFLPGNSIYAHGQIHELIEEVTVQIEKAPSAELYLKRGELCRAHGDLDGALADYDAAEKLAPEISAVWLCRARAFLEAKKPSEALAAADRFLETGGRNPLGYRYRGEAFRDLGRATDAAEAFAQMLQFIQEPRPEDYIDLARAWNTASRPSDGLKALNAGLSDLGSIPTLETEALEFEIKLGDLDGALGRLARLEAAAELKATWQARRADLLASAGRAAEADAAARSALASIDVLPHSLRRAAPTRQMEERMRQLTESSQKTTPTN